MHGVTKEGNKKVFVVTALGMSVYLNLLVFNLWLRVSWLLSTKIKKMNNYFTNKIFTIPGNSRVKTASIRYYFIQLLFNKCSPSPWPAQLAFSCKPFQKQMIAKLTATSHIMIFAECLFVQRGQAFPLCYLQCFTSHHHLPPLNLLKVP